MIEFNKDSKCVALTVPCTSSRRFSSEKPLFSKDALDMLNSLVQCGKYSVTPFTPCDFPEKRDIAEAPARLPEKCDIVKGYLLYYQCMETAGSIITHNVSQWFKDIPVEAYEDKRGIKPKTVGLAPRGTVIIVPTEFSAERYLTKIDEESGMNDLKRKISPDAPEKGAIYITGKPIMMKWGEIMDMLNATLEGKYRIDNYNCFICKVRTDSVKKRIKDKISEIR